METHTHIKEKDDYTPLVLVFTFILILSATTYFRLDLNSLENFMLMFEGYFFVLFALFKFVDLKTFVTGFSKYDLIAGFFKPYGYVYPLIELLIGVCFLANIMVVPALYLTVIVSTLGAIGVYKNIDKKIQCACLGAVINLPLSKVSLLEYVFMGLMALFMLIFNI
jgi:hypothetical protein